MQGGFSFCGTDIAELGLEYAPDVANTYVYAGSTQRVHEQRYDGHAGGYYYGATADIKTFTQRCIYQENHINEGILAKVENFFRVGKTGKQIFQKRPWVYYVATITSVDMQNITNYLNGFVYIQMKAYYPYGRCDSIFIPAGSEYADNMMANSAMLPESMATSTSFVSPGRVLTSSTECILYNGGSRPAPVAIEIAGDVGDGVVIRNETNGSECAFVALTSSVTDNVGKYLVCDGLNGRTVITNGVVAEDAALYHDYGFINLEPDQVFFRNELIQTSAQSSKIQSAKGLPLFSDDAIGNRIYLDWQWRTISNYGDESKTSAMVFPAPANAGTLLATCTTCNKITVTPLSTMRLTKLNFEYRPTFA